MRFGFLLTVVSVLGLASPATAQVRVKGYVKKDGTYVAPHIRSSPNATKLDNYSTKGNVNPYTGRTGTVDPYRAPRTFYPAPPTVTYTPPPSPTPRAPKRRCYGYGC